MDILFLSYRKSDMLNYVSFSCPELTNSSFWTCALRSDNVADINTPNRSSFNILGVAENDGDDRFLIENRNTPGADLRQKASSATLSERPPFPFLLLPPLSPPCSSFPSPSLPSYPFSFVPSPLIPFPFPSPPLEVAPSNPATGSGGTL